MSQVVPLENKEASETKAEEPKMDIQYLSTLIESSLGEMERFREKVAIFVQTAQKGFQSEVQRKSLINQLKRSTQDIETATKQVRRYLG